MTINTYLYKNEKLIKKYLNINAIYDKNMHRLEFDEEETYIQVTFSESRILYVRNNNDYIFKINYVNNQAIITIETMGKEFIIDIKKFEYRKIDNNIYISYIIETEEDQENKIIIELNN